MITLFFISLLIVSTGAQPFQRLTSQIASSSSSPFSNTQILNPMIQTSPDQLSGSTLTYPNTLNSQLNMPNVNLQGLSPATFTDPFAPQAASPATGSLTNMLPSGLGSSINTITSPFTTALTPQSSQTSPIANTLSNLFGPPTTTQTSTSPFFNTAPAQTTTNTLFPVDSNSLLFPSSFNSPAATQTSQIPAQLSTFSQQAPTIFQTNAGPQISTQPQFPSQPQAPVQLSSFNPAAIQSSSQQVQVPPNPVATSPFSAQAPSFPNAPSAPNSPSFPQQPSFPSGPVLLEAGSATVKPAATAIIRSNAPVVSTSPSLSSNPPFPALSSLPSFSP